ncbi:hypothetical protein AOT93_23710 [Mycobacteroides sp. H110]|nr:hypothetical protein AOT91_27790 [Mycobacteroides sp. H092]KRQ21595.1 hypothetical protein AOT87_15910 [Mycobacteroides sp. H003]KRQ41363.1 hypothetical protein AOT92_12495 [Mycobacteroides sp. H101]KRQ42813.1 hypothetical protein AOT88_24965 [Mycobacteroides sp. H063]KRQ63153.1 hypothetical protein AOT90_13585 [Mycobacteroides sp. H079]KRQ63797.1 hypothetical protein AOT94_00295 [Mycobacteroides sp. HXVII]KRQ75864.1 hypothetical protein AOT93_23710 [Mycobacteroides sp. H110]KRQ81791.1 hy
MRLNADKTVTWNEPSAPTGITPEKVFLGPDPFGLGGFQVAVATAASAPSRQVLRDLFTARKGRTQIQLVVAVVHDGTAYLFGPDPHAQPFEFPTEQAVRQLQSVLAEPDVLAATERFAGYRKASNSTGVPGFANSGLFATHHITTNVPTRADWEALRDQALPLLVLRRKQLIEALGFKTQTGPNGTLLLSIDGHPPRAVAVLLDDSEQFDAKTQRFQLSPVAFGLAVASRQEVPWLVVLRKDQIRLYPGRDGVGVGSKGQAETYFEVDLSTIDSEHAALLPLIFSASALAADGTADELLRDSARYAAELGARLRERIYDEIVPPLAVEVAQRLAKHGDVTLDPDGLATAYRVTLRILFRLLFQAYAEDRGLLPSGRNEGFDANSLKTNARRLLDSDTQEFGDSSTIWFDLVQVWNAIDQGNPQWQIPSYNGGLFSTDPERSPEGALIRRFELPDSVLGPALKSLLIDFSGDGALGPVDFRSLSVREFGTIYEGLLESSLSLTEEDLTVDSTGAWVPAAKTDKVWAPSGTVYFHTASGERKATGSYFTPKVVVDHLIEHSIVPALIAHLEKIAGYLTKGDAAAAARAFFDFRVADLAMGSGHFLVAAIDKIEALMRTFLTEHTVPGVTDELLRLAEVAKEALGSDDVAKSEVDEVGLLRRQVARRCIYGLDTNPMAVELARLALWIHTFVPGLPMSNLDHGLVNANSLTGIGTIDEALDALQPDRAPGQTDIFDDVIIDNLASAKTLLIDVANASEANKAEIEESARLLAAARKTADLSRRIFDAAVAARIEKIQPGLIFSQEDLEELVNRPVVADVVAPLSPAHMPYLFPEVFVRDNPGFDVLVGNPPWEELMVEEPKFWLRVRPGLFGLKPAELKREVERLREERADLLPALQKEVNRVEEMRRVLLAGPYPGLGTGDIDLYQAFAWRFWQLLRVGGSLAVVMPRSLFNAAGTALWREAIYDSGRLELVTLVNTRRWVFPIHPQYSIALTEVSKTATASETVSISGPFHSEVDFVEGRSRSGQITVAALKSATGAAIPQLAGPVAAEVLTRIRAAPRLDRRTSSWDFRPVAEFHATNDRGTFDAGASGTLPVIGGAGFELWNPSTGELYASGNRSTIETALQAKRQRQIKLASSAFFGQSREWAADPATLPLRHARIAFRDITRATDTRTMIAALVPPSVALTNKAPYLFRVNGSAPTEAFLLGVLSSIPLDWYARKYVELGMNFHILNGLPIPEMGADEVSLRVVNISGRLAAVDERYSDWAAEIGVPVGSVQSQADKSNLIAELDALVCLLYGLTDDQVEHVFATFHRGWDYEARLGAVLGNFRAWKGKV